MDRIHITIQNMMINFDEINQKTVFCEKNKKSTVEAEKWRTQGNQIYQTLIASSTDKQLVSVISLYSKSIAHAPAKSKEMALAYGDLSNLLCKLKKYAECLKAIDLCLKCNCPDNIKTEILIRKTECLSILKNVPAKKSAQEQALRWISQKVPAGEQKKMKKKLEEGARKKVEMRKEMTEEEIDRELADYIHKFDNPELPYSSSGFRLEYNEIYGRHLVATRNINPGEIITQEHPYLIAVKNKYRYAICWNCAQQVWTCIPCDHCVEVIYCSKECKTKAWASFHDMECDILHHSIQMQKEAVEKILEFGIVRALILGIKEYGNLFNLKQAVKTVDDHKDPRTKGFTEGRFLSDRYLSFYSLFNYLSDETFEISDLIKYTFVRVTLTLYVLATQSTILGKKYDASWKALFKDENVIFAGNLLFQHAGILKTNYCPIENRYLESHSFCINLVGSFINHQCIGQNVNIMSKYQNTRIVTIYPIKKGDQIFANYIGTCIDHKCERVDILFDLGVDCNCIACNEGENFKVELWLKKEDKNPEKYNMTKIMIDFGELAESLECMCIRFKDKDRIKLATALEEIRQVYKKVSKSAPKICTEMLMIQEVLDDFFYKLYVKC